MNNKKPLTFFSYSREDSEFALKLANDLRSAGVNIWIDQLDIPKGEHWDSIIQNALKTCESFLIILSPHSVASDNVLDELSYALNKRKQIIPVLFQNCEIPYRLERRQYIDLVKDYENGISEIKAILQIEDIQHLPLPLESEPKRFSSADIDDMLKKHDFYETQRNPEGKGGEHSYKLIEGGKVVSDEASGLMWQKSGSEGTVTFNDVIDYIDALNNNKFAGYDDWRLPSLEEAMSLMEAAGYDRSILIDPVFSDTQKRIWTGDKYKSDEVWAVSYENGGIYRYGLNVSGYGFVRAVRSVKSSDLALVQKRTSNVIDNKDFSSLPPLTEGVLSSAQIDEMLKKYNYYESRRNPTGKGGKHNYKIIEGGTIIYDEVSDLMWQREGSGSNLDFEKVKEYIDELNENKFAGYSDWRLPTLLEAMSIMEEVESNQNLHIDPVFNIKQTSLWTSSRYSERRMWGVSFKGGYYSQFRTYNFYSFVRAVRSGLSKDKDIVHDDQTAKSSQIIKLRSTPENLSHADFRAVSKKHDFYDSWVNPEGKGIGHNNQISEDGKVIFDDSTGLFWQQSGSSDSINYENARKYIIELNNKKFAGFSDWRLPTLEEACSLIEPGKNDQFRHTSSFFDSEQFKIWTSDKTRNVDDPGAWAVNFDHGNCGRFRLSDNLFVRAVRSASPSDESI